MQSNYIQPQLGITGLIWTAPLAAAGDITHLIDLPLTGFDSQLNFEEVIEGPGDLVKINSMTFFPGGVRLSITIKDTATLGSHDITLYRRSQTSPVTLTGVLNIVAFGGALGSNKPVSLTPFEDIGAGTNLTTENITGTTLEVASSAGTNATIPAATGTEAGLLVAADKSKLDGITGTNTGNQTLIHTPEQTQIADSNASAWVLRALGAGYANKVLTILIECQDNNDRANVRKNGDTTTTNTWRMDDDSVLERTVQADGSGQVQIWSSSIQINFFITGELSI